MRLAIALAFVLPVAGAAGAETIRIDAAGAAARAVEVSHAAASAAARVAAAGETVHSADAASLPSVAASASIARRSSVPEFRLPFALPGQAPLLLVPDITTTYGTALRVQQPLYSGGAISGMQASARHEGESATASQAQVVADLRLSAQLAYWEAIRGAANVEVARAQQDRAQRLLEDTRALLAAGMAVRADVLAAEERIASARVQLIAAQAGSDNARDALRSLLHIEPSDALELVDTLPGTLPAAPAPVEDLQSIAAVRRPELASGEARLAVLRSQESLALAPSRPILGAAAEWDYALPNQRYFPLTDAWKSSWSVGLLASWTVFDGGKSRADVSASRLAQRAASEDVEEIRRRIRVEVETDRRNLESALAAVTAADAAHAAAVEREKDARERHSAGLAPMVEILDAEAQLASAEQQQVDARAACWVASALLARAVGQ